MKPALAVDGVIPATIIGGLPRKRKKQAPTRRLSSLEIKCQKNHNTFARSYNLALFAQDSRPLLTPPFLVFGVRNNKELRISFPFRAREGGTSTVPVKVPGSQAQGSGRARGEERLRKAGPTYAEIVNEQNSGRQNHAKYRFPWQRQKFSSPWLPKALCQRAQPKMGWVPQIRSSTEANTHEGIRQYQSACRAVLNPQRSYHAHPKPAAASKQTPTKGLGKTRVPVARC